MGIRKVRFGEMKVDTSQNVAVTTGTDASINGANVVKGEASDTALVTLDPDNGANPDMKISINGGGKFQMVWEGRLTQAGQLPELNLTVTPEGGSATVLATHTVTASGDFLSVSEIYEAAPGRQVVFEATLDTDSTGTVAVTAPARFRVMSMD